MSHDTHQLGRRNVLKKGGVAMAALTVGVTTFGGTATAEETGVVTMNVDVPPVISSSPGGQIVAAIYPGGDMSPEDLVSPGNEYDHELSGFKLGPDNEDIEFDAGDVAGHADSIRYQLLPTGNMGVFFDSSTADSWFTSDDGQAKLSAIGNDGNGDQVMIAWGSDSVTVR